MDEKVLYQTTIINEDGLTGRSYVNEPNGLIVDVSSPLDDKASGTNPEQLLGLALATCLNATLQAEEKRRQLEHQSKVIVNVSLCDDLKGYQFKLNTLVRIPHVKIEEARTILKIAKERCPMVKLLEGSGNVTYHLIEGDETTDGNANIF